MCQAARRAHVCSNGTSSTCGRLSHRNAAKDCKSTYNTLQLEKHLSWNELEPARLFCLLSLAACSATGTSQSCNIQRKNTSPTRLQGVGLLQAFTSTRSVPEPVSPTKAKNMLLQNVSRCMSGRVTDKYQYISYSLYSSWALPTSLTPSMGANDCCNDYMYKNETLSNID